MYPLVVIVGPTAVGKSRLGIELANILGGEVISGDSIQVYRYLDIGSAKPTKAERQNIPHHLIDWLDPTESYTVAEFQLQASGLIKDIRARGKFPILVGGTGLYIRSLLDPYKFGEAGSPSLREKWAVFGVKEGKMALHEALRLRDPLSAQKLHPNDSLRIIRALEIYELTGIPFSAQREYQEREYPPLDPSIVYVGLTAPREMIYQRINQRCLNMIDAELVEETRNILSMGYSSELKPLQSIGYRHAIWHLEGLVTKTEMLRLLQRDTRHFAKRQLTWFNRDPRLTWYDITAHHWSEIVGNVSNTCRAMQTRVE